MKPTGPLFLLLATITSFLVAFLILPVLIRYTLKKNLVVIPGRRKIHKKNTPSLGGIAIFSGFLMASFFWVNMNDWLGERYVIASLFIIFLLGIRDDLVPFKAWNKMIGQIASVIVLLFSGIKINSLYGLLNYQEIPIAIGILLTLIFVILVTNAYNLIDGLDGLAGTISLISYLAFGIWFYAVGQTVFALLCFSMIGGLLAFLIFNWEPAEIFMGDTGAMVSGMMLAILTIHFMNINEALPEGNPVKFYSTVGTAASFIIVPLCDTVRIIILRISKGMSPFSPDKNHIHHGLIRLGLSHAKAALTLGGVSTLFLIGAILLRESGDRVVLPVVISGCIILSITIDRLLIRKVEGRDSREPMEEED